MNGTTFPFNPCYLPIHEPNPYGALERHNRIWQNFLSDLPITFLSGWNNLAQERIKEWNGTLINDVIVFDTEQDKMWFILRWS